MTATLHETPADDPEPLLPIQNGLALIYSLTITVIHRILTVRLKFLTISDGRHLPHLILPGHREPHPWM